MKVANLIYQLHGGGAEHVLSTISLNLSKEFEQYLLIPVNSKISLPYKGTKIDLYSFDIPNIKYSFFKRIKNIFKFISNIQFVKKNYKFDIVISHISKMNLYNALTKSKEKIILIEHNTPSLQNENKPYLILKLKKIVTKFLYSRADMIVAVSEGVKYDLKNFYGFNDNNIRVIYNPFDINNLKILSEKNISKQHEEIFESRVLVTVGSLTNQKAHQHLIKAISMILKEHNFKLIIIGEGPLRLDLERLIEDHGLNDHVYLLGYLKNPYSYIKKSNLFVLSSYFEGLPSVLIEAIALGIPVVSTDCFSGPREILSNEKDYSDQNNKYKIVESGVLVKPLKKENENKNREFYSIFKEGVLLALNHNWDENKIRSSAKKFDVKPIIGEWQKILREIGEKN